jgi:hypothetical protein
MSVLSNAVSAEKRKGLASLFGGASPTNTGADEFDLDVVCVATVFFFNRTVQMWNDVKCQCATMEAGKKTLCVGFVVFFFFSFVFQGKESGCGAAWRREWWLHFRRICISNT